jgi:hypothetical protein
LRLRPCLAEVFRVGKPEGVVTGTNFL